MKRTGLIFIYINFVVSLFAQQDNSLLRINQLVEKNSALKGKAIVEAISYPERDTLYFIDLRNIQSEAEILDFPITDNIGKSDRSGRKPLVTLNGKLIVNESLLSGNILARDSLDNVVCASSIVMDGITYAPYINIVFKDNYIPKAISLEGIKQKYTHFKDQPVIFQIDGKSIIGQSYDDFIIDEQNLSKILIGTSVKDEKKMIDVGVINLYTKEYTGTRERENDQVYLRAIEKIIETGNQKTAKSIHLNPEHKLSFVDLRGKIVDQIERDSLLKVPVISEKNND